MSSSTRGGYKPDTSNVLKGGKDGRLLEPPLPVNEFIGDCNEKR